MFIVLFTQIESKEIACESVGYERSWGFAMQQVCKMEQTTVISSDGVTIKPLDDVITRLSFDRNKKISYLPVYVSEIFPDLLTYSAKRCGIKSILKKHFSGMWRLVELFLGGNQIEKVQSDTFEDLTLLERLDLGNNKIKSLNSKLFRVNANHLQSVQLHGNECIDEDFENKKQIDAMDRVVKAKCGFSEAPTEVPAMSNLFDFDCGKSKYNLGMIVGGTETKRGQYPFLVALHHIATERFFCGGSLVSSRHVLTAAHCIQNKDLPAKLGASELVVLLGRYNLKSDRELGAVRKEVTEIISHPDWHYFEEKWDADLAILVLMTTVVFSNYIQPVCIPDDDTVESYKAGTVVSWIWFLQLNEIGCKSLSGWLG